MNDLISNEDVREVIKRHDLWFAYQTPEAWAELKQELSTIPIVEPVKHGRWITEHLTSTGGGTYPIERCSECEYANVVGKSNYCPNCGADMRERREDG